MQSFQRAASHYDQAAVLQAQSAHDLLRVWRARVSQTTGMWLDAGSGTGGVARALAGYGQRVWAVDQSHAMLQALPRDGNIVPLCADLRALPLGDQSVRGVVSNFALHWCGPDVAAAMGRVLEPSGWLIAHIPVRGSLAQVQALYPRLPLFEFQPLRDWRAAFDDASWSINQQCVLHYQTVYPSLRMWLQALRASGGAGTLSRLPWPKLRALLNEPVQPVPLDYTVWQVAAQRL